MVTLEVSASLTYAPQIPHSPYTSAREHEGKNTCWLEGFPGGHWGSESFSQQLPALGSYHISGRLVGKAAA